MSTPAVTLTVDANTGPFLRSITSASRQAQRKVKPVSVNMETQKASQALGRITGQANDFNNAMSASTARVIAFGASVGIINSVQRSFSELLKTTVKVEKNLKDINVLFNATSKELKEIGSELFNVAKETAQTFDVVTEAAVEFSRQGLSVAETLKRTRDALVLTRLSGLEAAAAVDALTASVNGFSESALDTTQIINRFAAVDAAFAVSSKDLADSLARAGSTAQDANVQFNELLSLTAAVQQRTARGGSVIGNAFKTIFARLQRSTTISQLQQLGVEIDNTQGGVEKLKALGKAVQNALDVGDVTKASKIRELGAGVRQVNLLSAALRDLNSSFSLYAQGIDISASSANAAIDRNEKLNQTLDALSKQGLANIQEALNNIGDISLGSTLKTLLNGVNSIFGGFNSLIDSEGIGSQIGEGILKGIGNVLTGPALISLGSVFLKIVAQTFTQVRGIIKEFTQMNAKTSRNKELQSQIFNILSKNNGEYAKQLSSAKNKNNVEKTLVGILNQELAIQRQLNKEVAQYAAIASRAGFAARSGGAGVALRGRSTGYVPNVAEGAVPSMIKESVDIKKGVGGAKNQDRPKLIPNFNFGNKTGPVVAHTGEKIIENFMGGKGSAVFNRNMIKSVGGEDSLQKFGRVKNVASGHTPQKFQTARIFRDDLPDNLVKNFQELATQSGGKFQKFIGATTHGLERMIRSGRISPQEAKMIQQLKNFPISSSNLNFINFLKRGNQVLPTSFGTNFGDIPLSLINSLPQQVRRSAMERFQTNVGTREGSGVLLKTVLTRGKQGIFAPAKDRRGNTINTLEDGTQVLSRQKDIERLSPMFSGFSGGFVPNFQRSFLGQGAFGTVEKLGRFPFVTKTPKPQKFFQRTASEEIIGGHLGAQFAQKHLSNPAISFTQPIGSMSRSLQRGYYGMPLVKNINKFTNNNSASNFITDDLLKDFLRNKFDKIPRNIRAQGIFATNPLDIHGNNFGMNDRMAKILSNIGRGGFSVQQRKINSIKRFIEKKQGNGRSTLDLDHTNVGDEFFRKLGKGGGKFDIFDPFAAIDTESLQRLKSRGTFSKGFVPNFVGGPQALLRPFPNIEKVFGNKLKQQFSTPLDFVDDLIASKTLPLIGRGSSRTTFGLNQNEIIKLQDRSLLDMQTQKENRFFQKIAQQSPDDLKFLSQIKGTGKLPLNITDPSFVSRIRYSVSERGTDLRTINKGLELGLPGAKKFIPSIEQNFGSTKAIGGEGIDLFKKFGRSSQTPFQKELQGFMERSGLEDIFTGNVGMFRNPSSKTGFSPKILDFGMAKGFIPNFNALNKSITREVQGLQSLGFSAADASKSIRVDSNPRLINSKNPSGIGVFNTIQESSLSDGIFNTARGQNPQTFGASKGFVPNFQDDPLKGISLGSRDIRTKKGSFRSTKDINTALRGLFSQITGGFEQKALGKLASIADDLNDKSKQVLGQRIQSTIQKAEIQKRIGKPLTEPISTAFNKIEEESKKSAKKIKSGDTLPNRRNFDRNVEKVRLETEQERMRRKKLALAKSPLSPILPLDVSTPKLFAQTETEAKRIELKRQEEAEKTRIKREREEIRRRESALAKTPLSPKLPPQLSPEPRTVRDFVSKEARKNLIERNSKERLQPFLREPTSSNLSPTQKKIQAFRSQAENQKFINNFVSGEELNTLTTDKSSKSAARKINDIARKNALDRIEKEVGIDPTSARALARQGDPLFEEFRREEIRGFAEQRTAQRSSVLATQFGANRSADLERVGRGKGSGLFGFGFNRTADRLEKEAMKTRSQAARAMAKEARERGKEARRARIGRFGQVGFGASIAASFAKPALEQSGLGDARDQGGVAGAGAGAALGALTGLQFGGMFGMPGIAGGLAIGGIMGIIDALDDTDVKAKKAAKSLEEFNAKNQKINNSIQQIQTTQSQLDKLISSGADINKIDTLEERLVSLITGIGDKKLQEDMLASIGSVEKMGEVFAKFASKAREQQNLEKFNVNLTGLSEKKSGFFAGKLEKEDVNALSTGLFQAASSSGQGGLGQIRDILSSTNIQSSIKNLENGDSENELSELLNIRREFSSLFSEISSIAFANRPEEERKGIQEAINSVAFKLSDQEISKLVKSFRERVEVTEDVRERSRVARNFSQEISNALGNFSLNNRFENISRNISRARVFAGQEIGQQRFRQAAFRINPFGEETGNIESQRLTSKFKAEQSFKTSQQSIFSTFEQEANKIISKRAEKFDNSIQTPLNEFLENVRQNTFVDDPNALFNEIADLKDSLSEEDSQGEEKKLNEEILNALLDLHQSTEQNTIEFEKQTALAEQAARLEREQLQVQRSLELGGGFKNNLSRINPFSGTEINRLQNREFLEPNDIRNLNKDQSLVQQAADFNSKFGQGKGLANITKDIFGQDIEQKAAQTIFDSMINRISSMGGSLTEDNINKIKEASELQAREKFQGKTELDNLQKAFQEAMENTEDPNTEKLSSIADSNKEFVRLQKILVSQQLGEKINSLEEKITSEKVKGNGNFNPLQANMEILSDALNSGTVSSSLKNPAQSTPNLRGSAPSRPPLNQFDDAIFQKQKELFLQIKNLFEKDSKPDPNSTTPNKISIPEIDTNLFGSSKGITFKISEKQALNNKNFGIDTTEVDPNSTRKNKVPAITEIQNSIKNLVKGETSKLNESFFTPSSAQKLRDNLSKNTKNISELINLRKVENVNKRSDSFLNEIISFASNPDSSIQEKQALGGSLGVQATNLEQQLEQLENVKNKNDDVTEQISIIREKLLQIKNIASDLDIDIFDTENASAYKNMLNGIEKGFARLGERAEEEGTKINKLWTQLPEKIADGLSSSIVSNIQDFKRLRQEGESVWDAIEDSFRTSLSNMAAELAQAQLKQAFLSIGSSIGGFFGSGNQGGQIEDLPKKPIPKFAEGGKVPAMVMGGEFEFKPQAVQHYGKKFFEDLNAGKISLREPDQKLASGGEIKGGSGVKDDVFGSFESGSFILNKSATQSNDKKALEKINELKFPAAPQGRKRNFIGALLGQVAAGALTGAVTSGLVSEVTGGDFWEGAKTGAITGGIGAGIGSVMGGGAQAHTDAGQGFFGNLKSGFTGFFGDTFGALGLGEKQSGSGNFSLDSNNKGIGNLDSFNSSIENMGDLSLSPNSGLGSGSGSGSGFSASSISSGNDAFFGKGKPLQFQMPKNSVSGKFSNFGTSSGNNNSKPNLMQSLLVSGGLTAASALLMPSPDGSGKREIKDAKGSVTTIGRDGTVTFKTKTSSSDFETVTLGKIGKDFSKEELNDMLKNGGGTLPIDGGFFASGGLLDRKTSLNNTNIYNTSNKPVSGPSGRNTAPAMLPINKALNNTNIHNTFNKPVSGFDSGGLLDRKTSLNNTNIHNMFNKPISGPKGQDTVPAMLGGGEFIVKKDAVDSLGIPQLIRMNQEKQFPNQKNIQSFNTGGLVKDENGGMQKSSFGLSSDQNQSNTLSNTNQQGAVTQSDIKINFDINIASDGEASVTESGNIEGESTNASEIESVKNRKFASKMKEMFIELVKQEQKPGGLLHKNSANI